MMEPLVAFRLWEIADGPQLRSATGGQLWDIGWTKADCPQHRAPGRGCSCGLYGYFDLHDTHQVSSTTQVLGAVLASGLVQVHALGLRAEYMRPVAFQLPPIVQGPPLKRGPLGLVFQADLVAHQQAMKEVEQEAEADVFRLAELYGCPVFDNDEDLLTYLQEWRL
jgi:hypothetical protein